MKEVINGSEGATPLEPTRKNVAKTLLTSIMSYNEMKNIISIRTVKIAVITNNFISEDNFSFLKKFIIIKIPNPTYIKNPNWSFVKIATEIKTDDKIKYGYFSFD
jgi:hypothetical protein